MTFWILNCNRWKCYKYFGQYCVWYDFFITVQFSTCKMMHLFCMLWCVAPREVNQTVQRPALISLFLWPVFSTGTFVICWTPGLVILLLDGLSCSECQVLKYEKYCLVLAECNSLVNPIIYSFRDKDMRTTYKRILCFPWRRMRQHEGPSGIRFESVKTGAASEKNSNNFTSLEPSSPQSLLCS